MNKNPSKADKEEIAHETTHLPDRDQSFARDHVSRPGKEHAKYEAWSGDVEDSIKGDSEPDTDLVDEFALLSGPPRTLDDRSPAPEPVSGGTYHAEVGDVDVIKKDLEQRRRELSEGIKASQAEAQAIIASNADGHPVDFNHPADMIEGDADYDKFLQLSRRQKAELLLVEHALERLANGDFGCCERCGDDIPIGRLKALPFAKFCISCQQGIDAEGGARAAGDMRI
jgi:DnaK suppressor protein